MSRSRRISLAGGLVFALALLVSGVFAALTAARGEQQFTVSSAQPDDGLVTGLKAAGITATVQDPALTASTDIKAEVAVASAQSEMGGLAGEESPTVQRVVFTDSNLGTPTKDGDVQATFENQDAWAVEFVGVQVPILGGPMDAERSAASYDATLVVLIDAKDGSFLEAAAI